MPIHSVVKLTHYYSLSCVHVSRSELVQVPSKVEVRVVRIVQSYINLLPSHACHRDLLRSTTIMQCTRPNSELYLVVVYNTMQLAHIQSCTWWWCTPYPSRCPTQYP
jgi:hypothetical protein